MDLFEAIRRRRSVRAFTREEVSEEDVERLIDAGRRAPSAGNIQPWEFIVVRKPETKRGLAIAALDQTFIEQAPVVIVVCASQLRSAQGYGARGIHLYSLQDTAAATQNILLAACALGLATCWIGAFREEEASRTLNLPEGVRPVAIIPVGHPAEKPMARPRKSLSEIIHYETY